jgi:hypothetical protein
MGHPLDDDITRRPNLYRDYGGRGVRIRPFWSSWWLRPEQRVGLMQSFQLIRNADVVLRKYKLSLDCVPSPGIFSLSARLLGSRFIVDCDGLLVPMEGPWTGKEEGRKLYDSFKATINEENRLVVVFVPLTGTLGYCVLEPEWLPWVLVDPSTPGAHSPNLLLHEIGHACRLGHQQRDMPVRRTQQEVEADRLVYRNVLREDRSPQDQLWNWQVDAFHDSYWCNGRRPMNWYMRQQALKFSDSNGNVSYLWEQ